MFEPCPNQWTPVLPLSALTRNPFATEIAGERIVLFLDNDDQWHALLDHCPHRGAALSLGKVTSDGHLRCGYHGWRYAGDGRCTGVPLNEMGDAALKKIHATALPTRHIGGAVWVFTGADADAVPEPLLPAGLQADPLRFVTYTQEWQANWTRAVENFIDFAHPPYLHEQTIGAWTHSYAEQGGTARVEVENTGFGMTMHSFLGNSESGFRLDWYRPNMSILYFGPDDHHRLHVFSIPVDDSHTRILTVRKIPDGTDIDSYARRAADADNRIINEDRIIVESQHGDVLSDPTEISVATDAPTLAFRRWYKALQLNGQ